MKRIIEEKEDVLSCVRLYLEDVEEIISILKDNNCKDIHIRTDQYSLSPDELSKVKEEKTNSLLITATDPIISVAIQSNIGSEVDVRALYSDARSRGIVEKIKDVLKRNKRTFVDFISKGKVILGAIIVMENVILWSVKDTATELKLGLLAILILIIPLLMYYGVIKKNIVYLKLQKDNPSWFKKNRDGIIVGVIIAIVSAILTYIITK